MKLKVTVLALVVLTGAIIGYTYLESHKTIGQPEKAAVVAPKKPIKPIAPTIPDLTELRALVNQFRVSQGLRSYIHSIALDQSAQDKCQNMVAENYWSHIAPDGTQPWVYFQKYVTYHFAAENLAFGRVGTAGSTEFGWEHSPEHRANLLNPKGVYVGYAECESNNYVHHGPEEIVVQHIIG